jgi:hypothetical protein
LHLVDDQNEALAVALLTATMLEVRSANLMDLAASVPRTSERIDMRGLSESHAESRGQFENRRRIVMGGEECAPR